jgi:hypothetical protein
MEAVFSFKDARKWPWWWLCVLQLADKKQMPGHVHPWLCAGEFGEGEFLLSSSPEGSDDHYRKNPQNLCEIVGVHCVNGCQILFMGGISQWTVHPVEDNIMRLRNAMKLSWTQLQDWWSIQLQRVTQFPFDPSCLFLLRTRGSAGFAYFSSESLHIVATASVKF